MVLVALFVSSNCVFLASSNGSAASPVDFLAPPTTVAVDTDGDSLFEQLEVSVSLNVSVPDWYSVIGLLYTQYTRSTSQVYAANNSFHNVSVDSTTITFDSSSIWAYGLNGAISIYLEIRSDAMLLLSSMTWTIGVYNLSSFDGQSADHLTGLCSDSGLDTDGDGLYEYLGIVAQANVTAGQYVLEGRILGVMDNLSAPVKTTVTLASWEQTLEIKFDGEMLMNAPSDGPYFVWLTLRRGLTFELLSSEGFLTGGYVRSQFSPSIDALIGQPQRDEGLDINEDGAIEYLALIVNITVKVAGIYNVTGTLSTFVGLVNTSWNRTFLETGRRNVTLLFSGAAIRAAEWNGTYWVAIQLLNHTGGWMQTSAHLTRSYSWLNFARPPVAAVVAKPVTNDGSASYTLNASTSSVDARFFEVRWDFDGDGVWDTGWSADPAIVHEFPGPGEYAVIVEIRDARGLTNQSRIMVTVLPDHSSGLVSNGYFPLSAFFLGVLLVGAVVLFFVWPVESLLIALLAVLLPLYTRLRRDDVLENYRRGMIHGFVLAHPGTSFTDMKEALSISSGSLVYHLSVLQDKGQLCSRRSGSCMRYYVNGSPMAEILRLGLTEFQMEIVKQVHSKGEASTRDLKKSVAASRQTLHYNLRKLVTDGILSSSFSKGHRVFRIASGAESDLRKALGLTGDSAEPSPRIDTQPSEDGSSRSPES